MPRITRKPNPHLKKIVLEETNDGRDVIRFLKNVIVHIEDGPKTFGIRPQDFTRTHKIDAARILARLGLEEGKRHLRRTYVRRPFKRVHPEEEDGPKRDMAASTAELYRLVRKETKDGAEIMLYFIRITKGLHPEFKPHLRMAAAKELIRQIEFDYDYDEEPTPPTPARSEPTEEPVVSEDTAESTEPVSASLVGAHTPQPATSPESNSHSQPTNPVYPIYPINPDSESNSHSQPTNPANLTNPENPDSDKITAHQENQTNHSSDNNTDHPTNPENPDSDHHISFRDFQRQLHIQDGSAPYRDYAAQHAKKEGESIYQSIIRRASNQDSPRQAKRVAEELITRFDDFMAQRDPDYQPQEVPRDLIANSLSNLMRDDAGWIFDPADYYDLDRDYFYYCLCRNCDQCDELDYYLHSMRELQEETDHLFEDP